MRGKIRFYNNGLSINNKYMNLYKKIKYFYINIKKIKIKSAVINFADPLYLNSVYFKPIQCGFCSQNRTFFKPRTFFFKS